MTLWIWFVVGAGIGYLASSRTPLSGAKGVVIGTLLGPFAAALFFIPSSDVPQHVDCPYCSNQVLASARLCQHCRALLS